MPKILVIGSTNFDLTLQVPYFPSPGETVLGQYFSEAHGGKGANQAVAAARAGGDVGFISCVGDDMYGQKSINQLVSEGIQVEHVFIKKEVPTGVAMIYVNSQGENCIAVAPGANNQLSPALISEAEPSIVEADVVLLQLEIPLETVVYTAARCRAHNTRVIFNSAPAQELPVGFLKDIDILVFNRHEGEILSGLKIESEEHVQEALKKIHNQGPQNVVLTMGKEGVYALNAKKFFHIPAYEVETIDTTAAGDVFCGNLAASIADDRSLHDSLRIANAAAALSVMKLGAQPSVPEKAAIFDFLKTYPV